MAEESATHVCLAGLPGSLALPVTGLYEVLNAFPMVSAHYDDLPEAPFEVEIVAPAGAGGTAASGLPLPVQRPIEEVERTDIIIIPSMAGQEAHGWRTGEHPEFVDWLLKMHDTGASLCSACSGALVLAETGLLDGRQATTHWAFADAFRRNFPAVELCLDRVLVVSGERREFAMSGVSSSWHDLALYLIARHVGPAAARAMSKFMLLDWHTQGQTAGIPFDARSDHDDAAILRLQKWLQANYQADAPVEEMAQMSALSTRGLERRFRDATGHSPIDYVQRLRVEAAKRRLETSGATVEQIAWDVGYHNPAFFRRLFKRLTRLTPAQYRRRYQVPDLIG